MSPSSVSCPCHRYSAAEACTHSARLLREQIQASGWGKATQPSQLIE